MYLPDRRWPPIMLETSTTRSDLSHGQAADLRWLSFNGKGFERCGCPLASQSEPFSRSAGLVWIADDAVQLRNEVIAAVKKAGSSGYGKCAAPGWRSPWRPGTAPRLRLRCRASGWRLGRPRTPARAWPDGRFLADDGRIERARRSKAVPHRVGALADPDLGVRPGRIIPAALEERHIRAPVLH